MEELKKSTSVYLREEDCTVSVDITNENKPAISEEIITKWQDLINTTGKLYDAAAVLIVKITSESLDIFISSATETNPYLPNDSELLGHGLYCETTIGRNDLFAIENSQKNKFWKDNPDVKLNMISYLGLPIRWPDGEMFGTICVLDNKTRRYDTEFIELLYQFKYVLEFDLKCELRSQDLQTSENLFEFRLKEIHHRIKNQFNLLSSIVQLKAMETQGDNREILDEIYGKIKSISLLYARIHESDDSSISINRYIEDIIKASASVYEANISIDIVSKTELDFKTKHLFEFGITFSELVTNSVKHGMPSENGRIEVEFDSSSEGGEKIYKVIYKDNGPGFSDDVLKGDGRQGTGSIVIQNFIEIFDADMKLYNSGGAVTEFTFKKPQS